MEPPEDGAANAAVRPDAAGRPARPSAAGGTGTGGGGGAVASAGPAEADAWEGGAGRRDADADADHGVEPGDRAGSADATRDRSGGDPADGAIGGDPGASDPGASDPGARDRAGAGERGGSGDGVPAEDAEDDPGAEDPEDGAAAEDAGGAAAGGGDAGGGSGEAGGGGTAREYDLDEAEELGGISRLSLPSRLIVAVVVAAVAVGAAFHLVMVFLSIAPTNTLSTEYAKQLNGYVYPEFEQNWKLFAPNPVQDNNDVEARARVRRADGSVATTGWVDLTAMDIARIRHDPIPSHTVQNELRRAWGFYTDTHDNQNRAVGVRGDLSQRYVLRIVAQRFGPRLNGGAVQEIQVRAATTPVGSPPWSAQKTSTKTTYRVLPWWAVTAEDYS